MRILRASGYKRMPWKNGGGETVEIAVFPPAASVDDFDWRISMATVASDGPFSSFEGVDRTLSVLTGNGLHLAVDGGEELTVHSNGLPYTFSAAAATVARLVDGPIRDLNIMTRRGKFGHRVRRFSIHDDWDVGASFVSTFVMAVSEESVEVDGTTLGYLDALILGPGETTTLSSCGKADVIVAKIYTA